MGGADGVLVRVDVAPGIAVRPGVLVNAFVGVLVRVAVGEGVDARFGAYENAGNGAPRRRANKKMTNARRAKTSALILTPRRTSLDVQAGKMRSSDAGEMRAISDEKFLYSGISSLKELWMRVNRNSGGVRDKTSHHRDVAPNRSGDVQRLCAIAKTYTFAFEALGILRKVIRARIHLSNRRSGTLASSPVCSCSGPARLAR